MIEIKKKGDLDHSDLDKSYRNKKMKNEGKLADMSSELRDSYKKLRDFERDIDNDLPQKKRLSKFREIALDMLENNKDKTR